MAIGADDDLRKGQGMTDVQQPALFESDVDQFEGEQFDFSVICTMQNIVDQIVIMTNINYSINF